LTLFFVFSSPAGKQRKFHLSRTLTPRSAHTDTVPFPKEILFKTFIDTITRFLLLSLDVVIVVAVVVAACLLFSCCCCWPTLCVVAVFFLSSFFCCSNFSPLLCLKKFHTRRFFFCLFSLRKLDCHLKLSFEGLHLVLSYIIHIRVALHYIYKHYVYSFEILIVFL